MNDPVSELFDGRGTDHGLHRSHEPPAEEAQQANKDEQRQLGAEPKWLVEPTDRLHEPLAIDQLCLVHRIKRRVEKGLDAHFNGIEECLGVDQDQEKVGGNIGTDSLAQSSTDSAGSTLPRPLAPGDHPEGRHHQRQCEDHGKRQGGACSDDHDKTQSHCGKSCRSDAAIGEVAAVSEGDEAEGEEHVARSSGGVLDVEHGVAGP